MNTIRARKYSSKKKYSLANKQINYFKHFKSVILCFLILPVLIFNISYSQTAAELGYVECVTVGPTKAVTFTEPTNVAFGSGSSLRFLYNQTGDFCFYEPDFFSGGGSGTAYCQPLSSIDIEGMSAALSSAFIALKNHINGVTVLSAAQIKEQETIMKLNASAINATQEILSEAFDLSNTYESVKGNLFPFSGGNGYPRTPVAGYELEYAMLFLQDHIIRGYSTYNLKQFPSVYNGAWFKTSEYFPGKYTGTVDPNNVRTVSVNASCMPQIGNRQIGFQKLTPAVRATGCYVVPGSLVKVNVPSNIIGKGYRIRVGAHFWDFTYKPTWRRLDRAKIVYPIMEEEFTIGSPLGGNIYLEVPVDSIQGIVDITFTGAGRSPFFSRTIAKETTLSEWLNEEKDLPGSWADFESDRFMFQAPSGYSRNLVKPVEMFDNWDKGMNAINFALGRPEIQGKQTVYFQEDLYFKSNRYAPGYPMVNSTNDPLRTNFDGIENTGSYIGPQTFGQVFFHELGHSHYPIKLTGEGESVVHVIYVALQNYGFGVDIDEAFAKSCGGDIADLKEAAIQWMIAPEFRAGTPMQAYHMDYTHRGHARYIEYAKLFGWEAFNRTMLELHERGTAGTIDDKLAVYAWGAGTDTRPLFHFWGLHPEVGEAWRIEPINEYGLKPSQKIYDLLELYKTYVPKDLSDCQAYIDDVLGTVNPNQSSALQRDYYRCDTEWSGVIAEATIARIQYIQDLYFPDGRPDDILSENDILINNAYFNIYPNPNSGKFMVEMNGLGDAQLSVFDISGRKVYNKVIDQIGSSHSFEINLEHLHSGVYFVNLNSEKGNQVKKVVISN